jgi:hypothetical protein
MITIRKELLDEINVYCQFNNISDINNFVNKIILDGFNVVKYGNKPMINTHIKKEVISPIKGGVTNDIVDVITLGDINTDLNKVQDNIYDED